MKLRSSLFACFALMALPQAAQAACSHNGVSYSVGATICSGGWLQECTPAGYWKAIGQCLKDDGAPRVLPLRVSTARGDMNEAGSARPAGHAARLRN